MFWKGSREELEGRRIPLPGRERGNLLLWSFDQSYLRSSRFELFSVAYSNGSIGTYEEKLSKTEI